MKNVKSVITDHNNTIIAKKNNATNTKKKDVQLQKFELLSS